VIVSLMCTPISIMLWHFLKIERVRECSFMLWIALYFPNLQLNNIVQAEEAKAPLPIAVLNARREIVQLNHAARCLGVERGMSLGTALAMAEELRCFDVDAECEERKLNELAMQCYALSGDIVVRTPFKCLLIEFGGMLKLYGSEGAYLKAVLSLLDAHMVNAHYALAQSPLVAELLARHAVLLPSPCLDIDLADKYLRQLPVSCLDVSHQLVKKIERLGLTKIGEVMALPTSELGVRLGPEFVKYLQALASNAIHALPRFEPPEQFSCSVSFDAEVSNAPALLFPAKRLLDRLECFLRQSSQSVQVVECVLFTRAKCVQNVVVASAHPETGAQYWHNLLRLKLEALSLRAPVLGMELCVKKLLPLANTLIVLKLAKRATG